MFFFLHIRYFQYSADMKNGLLKGAQSILQLKIDKILNLSILDEIDPLNFYLYFFYFTTHGFKIKQINCAPIASKYCIE